MTVATEVPTLDRALTQTGRVLGGVSREQFALPTPCAKWNVQALINHIIGGAFLFTEIAQGRAVTAETEPPDFAAGDYGDLGAGEGCAHRGVARAWSDGSHDDLPVRGTARPGGSQC